MRVARGSAVLCKFWQLYGGINGSLLQEGLCHTQVYTGSPVPSTPERREGLRACYWEGPSEYSCPKSLPASESFPMSQLFA